MKIDDARTLLKMCHRHELRDHAFGDRQVFWTAGPNTDDPLVAEGYFGGGSAEIWIHEDWGENGAFTGDYAKRLSACGETGVIGRKDVTGPDFYMGA